MEMKKIREVITASKSKEFIRTLFLEKYGCMPALRAIKSEYKFQRDEIGRINHCYKLTMQCDVCKATFVHQDSKDEKQDGVHCPHCGFSCIVEKPGWKNPKYYLDESYCHYSQVLGDSREAIEPCLVYYERTESDGEMYHVLRRFHFNLQFGEIVHVRMVKCAIASTKREIGGGIVYENEEGKVVRSAPENLRNWFCSDRSGEIPCANVQEIEGFSDEKKPLDSLLKYLDTLLCDSARYASKQAVKGRTLISQFPVREYNSDMCDGKQLELYPDYFVLRDFNEQGERYRWIYTQNGSKNTLLKKEGNDWLAEKIGNVEICCDDIFESNRDLIKGSFLEKIGILMVLDKPKDIFKRYKCDAVRYLNNRMHYPLIETLLKIGMERLIDSVCSQELRIDMCKKHIWQKMGLSKANYELIQRHQLSADAVVLLQRLNQFEGQADIDAFLLFKERLGVDGTYELKKLMLKQPMTLKCVATYLEEVWQYQGCPWQDAITIWHDYFVMYDEYYGHMPTRKEDRFPKSLKKEHDLLVKYLNEKKDESSDLSFREVNKEWEKLCYSDDQFCITLPQSSADLNMESKELGHCVRGYSGDVLSGSTVILFLRKSEKPQHPFFTMEFNGVDRITQIRGKANRQIKEISDIHAALRDGLKMFLHAWGKKNHIKVDI